MSGSLANTRHDESRRSGSPSLLESHGRAFEIRRLLNQQLHEGSRVEVE
jgi:hypothetical protein